MRSYICSFVQLLILTLSAIGPRTVAADELTYPPNGPGSHLVTNAAQFWNLSGEDFLAGRGFLLSGVVTLVDTNRGFLVLQDATGAVGLNYPVDTLNLQPGEAVSLGASNCVPSLVKFSDYPYRPSGWEVRNSIETPVNWGEYNLTRLRGYIHPPVTGQYTFWIASDNSSELWLSTDAERFRMRKIASVARFQWTLVHEWTKFPSQRSEAIWLNAGQSYYLEALQEQTSGGENLAVAWQGPDIPRSVISAAYLTPWNKGQYATAIPSTNGILREYWTNYSAGDLENVGGPRPFQSILSADKLFVIARNGEGHLPAPCNLTTNQSWARQYNYRWATAEGIVKFVGGDGNNIFVELSGSKMPLQARVLCSRPGLPRITNNAPVHIEGVCEAVYDETGAQRPGIIWVTTGKCISVEVANAKPALATTDQPLPAQAIQGTAVIGGFYGMRGVVTFNGRVFGKDCLFVQQGNLPMFVSRENLQAQNQLAVGQLVDLGGALETGKALPIITPLVITKVGWSSLPTPANDPIQYPIPSDRDGRWTEIQGVVHSINPNGTLSVMSGRDSIAVWLGNEAPNELNRYLDAGLRAWGVLSLSTWQTPVLLVPSCSYLEVDEAAPADPFSVPVSLIADLKRETADPSSLHRAKVKGEITLQDSQWFFVQDGTGGIRVLKQGGPTMKIGEAVEVLGFPAVHGATRVLSDAVVRAGVGALRAKPAKLDLIEGLPVRQNGSLVGVRASLLKARTIGNSQILELQDGGRVFTATLPTEHGRLAEITPGSQLEITGVCDTESTALPVGTTAKEKAAFASLNLWLRSPDDLKVLHGPPWWTWKRASMLIGALLTILAVALLWVYFLRRRLERQKALQLAFSQQVLKRLEDERRRIAANLHDGLGQVLLAIRNQALLAMQRTPEENGVRQRLEEISGATSQAIEEVRQITYGLRPHQLNRLGLTQAIRASVNRVSLDSQIVFASRVEDIDNIFDTDSEIHVYRIVQEAINNIIKHSDATEATVVIKKRTNCLSLSIRDNGRGFDVNSVSAAQPHGLGYGLSGIAERVRILGGTLTIDSHLGGGTSLTIEIPIQVERHETGNNHIDRR